MMNILILGLVVLAVAGMVATTHAQEPEYVPIDIHAEVVDIHIERDLFVDWWYITVVVTNNEQGIIAATVSALWLEDDYGWLTLDGAEDTGNACLGEETAAFLEPDSTATILGCFPGIKGSNPVAPKAISVTGVTWTGRVWSDEGFGHVLPFKDNACNRKQDHQTCQSVQNIDHLIRAAEREADSEPMTCEVPTTTDQPRLMSAAYHVAFADLVLSFDEDVTLVDGWQGNITIGGISIGDLAKNHMEGASGLAWISVDYAVRLDIQDVDSHTVIIDTGTFMDADGNTNDRIEITPSITG